ncbi:hypothetical protein HCN44_010275 [Aphidius gifuensis]|uniref:Uncharacterized protein n=1 Tax=Aphidius gifuensis TaxID=684658 RepID=A0A835CUT2_APHGI|nr:hypothetical protein HCN44_010275 [Aphidius gifuensis]
MAASVFPRLSSSSSLQKTRRSTRLSKQNERPIQPQPPPRRRPSISSIIDPDTDDDDDDVNMVVTPTPSTSTSINNNKQQLKNNDGSSSIIQRLSQELARTAVLDNNNMNMDIDDDLIVERQRREMTQIFGSQKSMQDKQLIKSQEWVVKSFSQPSTSENNDKKNSINSGKTSTSTKKRQRSAGDKKFANEPDKKMYTIQMGLRTLLKITKDTKSTDQNYKIYSKIQSDVERVSKWKIGGSYFLEFCINQHRGWRVNHIFSNGGKKIIPQIFNILKIPISQGKQPVYDVNLIELYNENCSIITRLNETDNLNIPLRFDVHGLAKLCDDQIETYLTCFETNINTHKYKRLFKFIKNERNISGQEAYNILSDLIEHNIRPEKSKLFNQFQDLNFKLFNNNSNWYKFLPFFIELQKLTTNFIVVPINHFGWHHIRYSTSAFCNTII